MDNEKLMYLIQKIDNRGETLEKNVASLNTNVHSLDKKLAEAEVDHKYMRQMLTDADSNMLARVNTHDEDIIDLKSAASRHLNTNISLIIRKSAPNYRLRH